MNTIQNSINRRSFLKTSSAAMAGALAGPLVLTGPAARAAGRTDELKVGLIGCGGRGTGAALQALKADSGNILTAVGDVFIEKCRSAVGRLRQDQTVGDRVRVEPSHMFVGLDAFQKVIDSGVDVVILATPPGFRPQHVAAAVAAGKHMFCEKPVATDPHGVRSVLQSYEESVRKNLCWVAGFCWRREYGRREFYKRVHAGEIGPIRAIYATYYTGPVKPMPPPSARPAGMSDVEWQIRNWYNFVWLSGDGLVEQAVHSVDKVMWAMKDEPPVRAVAVGGRQTPNHEGNIYDHMHVVYEFANGTRAFLGQRQISQCFNQNSDFLMGAKAEGVIDGWSAPYIKSNETGERLWRYRGPKNDMYQTEHDELFDAIRSGKVINDGKWMTHSTLAAIMGRMAAYTGKMVTWEQALNSKLKLVPDNLTWDMRLPIRPMAIPGQTPLI